MQHPDSVVDPLVDSLDFYEAELVSLIEAAVSRSAPVVIALQRTEAALARLEALTRPEVDRP